ncbi:MAG: hypothetical protein GY940_09340 [bacterium]|nr:hypothetical protein [bacterium]
MSDTIFGKHRLRWWFILFVVTTVIGLLNFSIIITNQMASSGRIRYQYPLINELTGAYATLLLLPFLLWFFKRWPIRRSNWVTYLPLYFLVSVLFGVSHTLLMKVSRTLIYPPAGLGEFNYGNMGYRFLMEYQKQVIVFWVIFAVVFFVGYMRRNQEQRLRNSQLEEALTKARLQALQMQLNPHFLFNTLNMISSTMYENVAAADQMIAYLSDLLRITLKRSNREEYSLEKELELLNLYTEIMKARFRDKLTIRMNIEAGTGQAMIPGFILQPLVENSIKYGMDGLGEVEVTVNAQKVDDRLVLTVSDNGPGIPGEPAGTDNEGVGLSNTEERLEKLYGDEHRFVLENIDDGSRGLRVTMEIPFQTSGNNP